MARIHQQSCHSNASRHVVERHASQILNNSGTALLEVLLAAVIGALGISLIAQVFVGRLPQMRRIAAQEMIEAEVSRDLNWIRQYSKYWRLNSGPYDLTDAQVGQPTGTYQLSSHISYFPDSGSNSCAGLVDQFLIDANRVTITPPRVNPVVAGATVIALSPEAAGYTLSRSITPEGGNRLLVAYTVNPNGNPPLSFSRDAMVLLPASGAC